MGKAKSFFILVWSCHWFLRRTRAGLCTAQHIPLNRVWEQNQIARYRGFSKVKIMASYKNCIRISHYRVTGNKKAENWIHAIQCPLKETELTDRANDMCNLLYSCIFRKKRVSMCICLYVYVIWVTTVLQKLRLCSYCGYFYDNICLMLKTDLKKKILLNIMTGTSMYYRVCSYSWSTTHRMTWKRWKRKRQPDTVRNIFCMKRI